MKYFKVLLAIGFAATLVGFSTWVYAEDGPTMADCNQDKLITFGTYSTFDDVQGKVNAPEYRKSYSDGKYLVCFNPNSSLSIPVPQEKALVLSNPGTIYLGFKLKPADGAVSKSLVRVEGKDIVLKDFEITGPVYDGVAISGTTTRVEIKDSKITCNKDSASSGGIYIYRGATENIVDNVEMLDCKTGVLVNGDSNVIKNSTFKPSDNASAPASLNTAIKVYGNNLVVGPDDIVDQHYQTAVFVSSASTGIKITHNIFDYRIETPVNFENKMSPMKAYMFSEEHIDEFVGKVKTDGEYTPEIGGKMPIQNCSAEDNGYVELLFSEEVDGIFFAMMCDVLKAPKDLQIYNLDDTLKNTIPKDTCVFRCIHTLSHFINIRFTYTDANNNTGPYSRSKPIENLPFIDPFTSTGPVALVPESQAQGEGQVTGGSGSSEVYVENGDGSGGGGGGDGTGGGMMTGSCKLVVNPADRMTLASMLLMLLTISLSGALLAVVRHNHKKKR